MAVILLSLWSWRKSKMLLSFEELTNGMSLSKLIKLFFQILNDTVPILQQTVN